MCDAAHMDPSVTEIPDKFDKQILTEAPQGAWRQPKPGDIVNVEVSDEGSTFKSFRWTVGAQAPSTEATLQLGLNLDAVVRSMRRGEEASFRGKGAGTGSEEAPAVIVRLPSFERSEDLFGDDTLVRVMVEEGKGWQTPQPGTEVKLRFSWRTVPAEEASPSASPSLQSGSQGSRAAVPPAHRDARVVVAKIEDTGNVVCTAEDWIPGPAGFRVISDMAAGARCRVRVAPQLAFGATGLPELGLPPDATLEYEVEVLIVMTLEDVSLDGSGSVMKKTTKEGDGYSRPHEGAEVTIRLEAHEEASGAVLLEEREVIVNAASGKYLPAVDETLLTMKPGEVCEVRCASSEACDEALGLRRNSSDGPVIFCLELVEFKKVDLTLPEELVPHCARRKEVGAAFFKEKSWRRALKRYQHVTSQLQYVDHWEDASRKSEAIELRRLCNLNAAACLLKLEAWSSAERACSAVLAEDPDNVKALFRKGQASKELNLGREAEQCFRRVLELDTENKEAKRMLVLCKQMVKEEVDKEKELYGRMTQRLNKTTASQQSTREPNSGASRSRSVRRATQDTGETGTDSGKADDNMWLWLTGLVAVLGVTVAACALARRR